MGIKNYTSDDYIRNNRESFRAEATEALRRFTPDDRERAASLETEHVLTSDVLKIWFEQLEPMVRVLDEQKNDSRFVKSLQKRFGFSEHAAEDAVARLALDRKNQLLDEVLTNLYHADIESDYQRAYAEEFLNEEPSEIERFSDDYSDFIEALDAAEKHAIAVFDPYGSWLERQRAALAVNRERARSLEDEEERLSEIDAQLEHLTTPSDSLVAYVIQHNWDYARVLDLYEKYHKKVTALSETDHKNPAKRLKLFERVTADFRDRESARLAERNNAHSLSDMKKLSEQVYARLLEIFDLPTRERQHFLNDIRRYARLSQERDLIQTVRANRKRFLASE